MDKIKEFLSSMGFRKNEVDVYTALLGMGPSSTLEISKDTKIHRSNVYDVLRYLVSRSLVFQTNKETKTFSARPINSLLDFLKIREIELKSAIEEYATKRITNNAEEKVRLTKGKFAFQAALYSLLDSKDTIKAYGIPKEAPDIAGPILNTFHKDRAKKGINMRHIYNSDGKNRAKYLNKLPLTEARILPLEFDSRATTNISGDKVFIVLWDDDITILEIKDPSMAEPYKNYFNILWEKAVKP